MSSTLGSANIGGNNYNGVWSGKPYQDPIGAATLPNQGAGGIKSANSLNGHIGANWMQGPVLPPANQWIQSDHGPAVSNTGDLIYWQTASGSWADVENAGTPLVGAAQKTGVNTQLSVLANPAFTRQWNVGDEVTFSSVNGLPATQTAIDAMTGEIEMINAAGDRVVIDMGASVAALNLTGWAAVVTVTTP